MELACRDLLEADPIEGAVTEVAFRGGFVRMSRFAQAYRARSGELPSETLRKDAIFGQPSRML
jgi:transcriptional regulator GlxA family with amidase domain